MKRKIIGIFNVDEELMSNVPDGPIDYFTKESGWLNESGFYLEDSKILDEDDPEDKIHIESVNSIFDGKQLYKEIADYFINIYIDLYGAKKALKILIEDCDCSREQLIDMKFAASDIDEVTKECEV